MSVGRGWMGISDRGIIDRGSSGKLTVRYTNSNARVVLFRYVANEWGESTHDVGLKAIRQ